ncbi:MAG: type II toxin-antitoxin system HicA family toxin [Kiritimatiellae bacterium]|nr:type II toxin-antitoxin system HicA family toxin [Kiritimatiellia bacterium]
MKPLSFRDAVQLAQERGFAFRRANGSHCIFRAPDGRRVTIPRHAGDIPNGTARSILRTIGIDPADWQRR